ncbi:autoinducer binding domain-containing protein [Hoeflea sp. YIM 152468]|uniref:helix-turn-helix transcriptional regulator n=1 Tax=Hoeflea sp. YIM 152468 TaxID=3031759 RepID=UPI0023D9D9B1|nr:autoinducer binding domain-containing protein [Hoeflea sp. YIM 152468]MDF1608130.1 autoinducer binding domain-containing protein [Hoeflea sp. YIM 152468]
MNMNGVLQFLEAETSGFGDANAIRSRICDVLTELGFDFFTLVRQPGPESDATNVMLAGQWPKGWPELYVKRKYAKIDPTVRYLGHSQRGYRWAESIEAFDEDPQRKRMERMMVDAQRYGMDDGYVFPVHGRRGLVGVLSVAGRSVDLSLSQMAMMDAMAKKAFWALLEAVDPGAFAQINRPVAVQLTRREMETLEYLGYGMTSNEMGATLGLSAHTVDWYMNGIQDKLHAKNRHHVVAIAFRLGLIS